MLLKHSRSSNFVAQLVELAVMKQLTCVFTHKFKGFGKRQGRFGGIDKGQLKGYVRAIEQPGHDDATQDTPSQRRSAFQPMKKPVCPTKAQGDLGTMIEGPFDKGRENRRRVMVEVFFEVVNDMVLDGLREMANDKSDKGSYKQANANQNSTQKTCLTPSENSDFQFFRKMFKTHLEG